MDVFQKQCFAVFCGVLWCFAVFYVRVFSVFHKTAQNRPKSIRNAQNEQNTLCALCNTAQYGAVHLSLTQKMSTKNIRKTRPKHCKTSAKHRKPLFFKKHSQNTTKHPQNTHKTPQNTAKHHKTHLLTKQTELANKPLRSRAVRVHLDLEISPHLAPHTHINNNININILTSQTICTTEKQAAICYPDSTRLY